MWNSDEWKQFLITNCSGYPLEDLDNDSKFLCEQKLGPCRFNSLIEIYYRDFNSFKQSFPNFFLGNLIALIDGLKSYTHNKGTPKKSTELVATPLRLEGPSHKRLRLDQNTPEIMWFEKVKEYILYFVREGEKENYPRRCACAISPTTAVTFAHRRNKQFKARITNKGKLVEPGSIIKLFSYNQDKEAISAEVVVINQVVDFILLEAVDGNFFYKGVEGENILQDPLIGMKLLAVGLSSNTSSQEAVTTGVVLSAGPLRNHQMVSDIAWGGDSGGGLFDPSGKLLGIIAASQESDEEELTRTYFAPANEIRTALEMFLEEAGKKAKPQRLHRLME